MSSTTKQQQSQGVSAQGFANKSTSPGQSSVQTIPYTSSVELSVESALRLFSEGQVLCLQSNHTLSGDGTPQNPGALAIATSLRREIDDLNHQLAQKASAFMVDHDWNQYGRTNEEWRDAKTMTELSKQDEYNAWNDERDEKTGEYQVTQNVIVTCTNNISIGKRQMDFATSMLNLLASSSGQSHIPGAGR